MLLWTATAPSSSLVLELSVDATGALNVQGFFNDQPFQLGGCTSTDPCPAASFVTYLGSVAKINDVSAACKGTTPT